MTLRCWRFITLYWLYNRSSVLRMKTYIESRISLHKSVTQISPRSIFDNQPSIEWNAFACSWNDLTRSVVSSRTVFLHAAIRTHAHRRTTHTNVQNIYRCNVLYSLYLKHNTIYIHHSRAMLCHYFIIIVTCFWRKPSPTICYLFSTHHAQHKTFHSLYNPTNHPSFRTHTSQNRIYPKSIAMCVSGDEWGDTALSMTDGNTVLSIPSPSNTHDTLPGRITHMILASVHEDDGEGRRHAHVLLLCHNTFHIIHSTAKYPYYKFNNSERWHWPTMIERELGLSGLRICQRQSHAIY